MLAGLVRMQVASGFVGEDHGGFGHQRPRNAYQLLLPARQLTRKQVFLRHDIESVEQFGYPAFALTGRRSFVEQRRFDILIDCQFVNQVIGLKHEANPVPVQFGPLLFGQFLHRLVA